MKSPNEEKVYPISEVFTSIQGEATYAGCMMTFIRTAGCSVGRPVTPELRQSMGLGTREVTQLPVWQKVCTSWSGEHFLCDTDFNVKERLTVPQLLAQIPEGVKHVCITGGEPLNHYLQPLVEALHSKGMKVHLETSGTVPLWHAFGDAKTFTSPLLQETIRKIWVTVSPKLSALPEVLLHANEIKLLINDHFDVKHISPEIKAHSNVWVQPINGDFDIDLKNVQHCLALIGQFPEWRLSVQLHKVIRVR